MKFTISRSSDLIMPEKPCEEAVLSEQKTLFNTNIWEIEINSLEELLKLKQKVGFPIIVSDPYHVDGQQELEIYDAYRE